MPEAEEDDVYLRVRLVGETQFRAPEQIGVGLVEGLAGTGTTEHKIQPYLRVTQQDPDELAPRISGTPYDTCSDHFC
jgi:hypothetical protein